MKDELAEFSNLKFSKNRIRIIRIPFRIGQQVFLLYVSYMPALHIPFTIFPIYSLLLDQTT